MANVDRPNGFKPVGTLSGSPWQGSIQQFALDGSHAEIAVGDLVEMTADGYLDVLTAGATDNGVIGVVVGIYSQTATPVSGMWGDSFLSTGTIDLDIPGKNKVAANTEAVIAVCTAPDLIMEAQEDADTTPLTLAAVGAAVDIVNGGASSTTGISGMEIDSDSVGNTATDPLKILGMSQKQGNELASVAAAATPARPQNARWLVTFNTHHYRDNGGI